MNEKKKPVPGGRVVSTDYRSAYREEEEAKHAREFAAQEEPEKPAAPVPPAAPAEEDLPEQDDFVTDPQDRKKICWKRTRIRTAQRPNPQTNLSRISRKPRRHGRVTAAGTGFSWVRLSCCLLW